MLPLIPTLALALVSFISSSFVILRIVVPILPPNPLSRRVPPSEFGLPNFKTLSPADKSHLWLASLDIIALVIFVWEALNEYFGGVSGFNVAFDPASAVRLWIATTLRQSCLLMVATLTLLHVRLGRSVAFGPSHWMLWVPTLLVAGTSTAMAGILAVTGVESFFWGLLGYSTMLAILSSVSFACLIGTLVIIRRNLSTLSDMRDPWPPARTESDKPRVSFDTADVDALKEGSSWITSHASSRHDSFSAFSFSTHHTSHSRMPSNASSRIPVNSAMASNPSLFPKSAFWFNPATPGRASPVPPVPPLPAPYRPSTSQSYNVDDDPDPFRSGPDFRVRAGSQSSWLTEPSGYQPTLSAWSFPPSSPGTPCPSTPDLHSQFLSAPDMFSTPVRRLSPAMVTTDVLGGYGYAGEASRAESGATTCVSPANEVDVSVYRAVGWLITIWVPMVLALPYYVTVHPQIAAGPWAVYLLVISVTISSPLLAANIMFRSPLPIPSGLFDTPSDPPSIVMRAPSPATSSLRGYKQSGSVTVVEGHRSGDIWLANGDAVEGKGKLSRAISMLHPKPKLSVMPLEVQDFQEVPLTPEFPMQEPEKQFTYSVPTTPQNANSAEFHMHEEMGTRKKDSKASSYFSNAEENFATQIMIAQRHYSTLAMTMVVPPSPDRRPSPNAAVTSAVNVAPSKSRQSGHLRARSVSSIVTAPQSPLSGPPSTPLPPTPPTLKNFKAAVAAKRLTHKKSYSTLDEFSFGPHNTCDITEIDDLSASILPFLVPGLKVGNDIKITESWNGSPTVTSRDRKAKSRVPSELDGLSRDFSSPEQHSTPRQQRAENQNRQKKGTANRKHHFSLPSLSLGENGVHSATTWRQDLNQAFETQISSSQPVEYRLNVLREEDERSRPTSPAVPFTSGFSDTLAVPEYGLDSRRNSLTTLISALDQELQKSSSGSKTTLHDFDPGMDGLAVSTPREIKVQLRRSTEAAATVSLPSTVTATQPLVPKSKKAKHKASKSNQENEAPVAKKGLRPLSLLQSHDTNVDSIDDVTIQGTRPLSLRSKGKASTKLARADVENVRQQSGLKKALKPLKLVRTETTKERAMLREQENLPSVVVRPPSGALRW